MNLTPAQQRSITHRGSNLLVSASAGSGKTEVLARRCVGLLIDPNHPCPVERLLVVTFTRAAAAELRVRIGRMLGEAAEGCRDARQRAFLRRQALLIDLADIGTIDAWCGRLLREHYAEAGIDPGFGVLGAQDAVLLRRRVLEELFTGIHRGVDDVARAAQDWVRRSPQPNDEFLRQMVLQLNTFREHLVNPEAWFERQATEQGDEPVTRVLCDALRSECAFQSQQLTALTGGNAEPALASYRVELEEWSDKLANVDASALLRVAEQIEAFKFPRRKKGDSPPTQLELDVSKSWHDTRLKKAWPAKKIAGILRHAGAVGELTQTLLALEAQYVERLQTRKRQSSRYEFADVLRLTLDLLGTPTSDTRRTPTDVARELQEHYEHILVDEYQDTSPVQVEILRLVTRSDAGCTNRFMVGDVKQSIYGFRQAEPALFSALQEAYQGGLEEGRVEFLADNFRTHADLLSPLNAIFARLFDRELGGTDFGPDERLQPGRAVSEIANPTLDAAPRLGLELVTDSSAATGADDDDEDGEVAVERIEREAQITAERIQALLADGTQIPQRDEAGVVTLRPLCRSDIVVLLRSAKQNADRVVTVLRANGIPCLTDGREALLETLEAHDVRSVLELIVNRRQDVALAAYLRGPLAASEQNPDGSLTPAELLEIRQQCSQPRADLLTAVEAYLTQRPDPRIADRLCAALVRLERWAELANDVDLPTLLQSVLADSAYLHCVRALPGGRQRVAVVRALHQFAEQFADSEGGGVADFVAYLDALADERVEPATTTAASDDAVRVMTIHGAKGLEFPVVFLLGAGARFNAISQRTGLMCNADTGFGLRFADVRTRAELVSATHLVTRRRIAERELEEELRLLYVATTRARELLTVVGHAKPDAWEAAQSNARDDIPLITRLNARCYLDWLLLAIAAGGPSVSVDVHDALAVGVRRTGARQEEPVSTKEVVDAAQLGRIVTLITTTMPSGDAERPAVYSVSQLKQTARDLDDADMPAVIGPAAVQLGAPAFETTDQLDGRATGTATHRFLELADLPCLAGEAAIRAEIKRLTEADLLDATDSVLIDPADLAWFGTTDIGRLLQTHCADVRREVPFVYAVSGSTAEDRPIVRGVIDCLIAMDEGFVLLDYKTDAIREEAEFAERLTAYAAQLSIYAQVVEQLFERTVSRAGLVFLHLRRLEFVDHVTLTGAAIGDLVRATP